MDDAERDLEKGLEERISNVIKSLLDEHKEEQDDRGQYSQSICKVPDDIRSPNFYKTIKIGLINCNRQLDIDDDKLRYMFDIEDIKIRYMYDLFKSLQAPTDAIRNECVRRVYSKFNHTMACYGKYPDTCSPKESSELCMLIVVDACYIISLIHKWSQYVKHTPGNPYLDESLSSLQTKHDLIVLDNQIPFFVLQDIFACTISKLDPAASLVELILSFLKDVVPFEANSITGRHGNTNYKHILDLLYKYYQPTKVRSLDRLSTVTRTYSAVELAKAGVKFKPSQDKMAITFESSWCNPTLTMPAMRIDESTLPVLWNLASYERCYPEVGNYIASYAFAMMMIGNTKEDLLKLGESKVIRNPSGHLYIVDTIHDLCKGVVLKEFLYAKEWRKMDK